MTLLAAALIGGGVATMVVALLAVGTRRSRTRTRRRERRTVPGARPARPGQPPHRTGPSAPPPARPKDGRSRNAAAPPGAHRPLPPPTEALGGETLQLGPVPAWKVPVPVPAGPSPSGQAGRGEYASAAAAGVDGDRTVPDLPQGQRAGSGSSEGETRNDRELRGTPSVVTNASRRHDPRTSAGRVSGR